MRFGSFEFDAGARRLRGEGGDVHLPPKVFELLAALLEAAPSVVSKRDLHARLWPGGVVADATLVALVKQLRAALGDRDRKAPIIRTVHRVGYALEATHATPQHATPAAAAPLIMECWLQLGRRRLPLAAGENIVGRDAAARIRLDDAVVSRRHARIVISAAGAWIEDLGSKNGTFAGSRRITGEPVALHDGVALVFGTLRAIYGASSPDIPTRTSVLDVEP